MDQGAALDPRGASPRPHPGPAPGPRTGVSPATPEAVGCRRWPTPTPTGASPRTPRRAVREGRWPTPGRHAEGRSAKGTREAGRPRGQPPPHPRRGPRPPKPRPIRAPALMGPRRASPRLSAATGHAPRGPGKGVRERRGPVPCHGPLPFPTPHLYENHRSGAGRCAHSAVGNRPLVFDGAEGREPRCAGQLIGPQSGRARRG